MSVTGTVAATDGPRLRVLVVHDKYLQPGGEDQVVVDEVALLQREGHEVRLYQRDNRDLNTMSLPSAAIQTLWSRRTTRELALLGEDFKPHLIHAHNTFPLVSPSLYWAAAALGIPVVQTLHNFRLLCVQAMFLRDGHPCETCLGKVPWRGVVHACYKGSVSQSAVLAGMLSLHRLLGTYRNKVARYIALNEFCRRKFVEGGLPEERVVVKPNFVDGSRLEEGPRSGGLFIGRLAPEKGVSILIAALRKIPTVTVEVLGDGPCKAEVSATPGIVYRGWGHKEAILAAMGRAAYLLLPSIWYENLPRTLVEAYAAGLPVIASRLGALAELVDDGKTGLLFEPGSADELAAKISWAESHPDAMRRLGAQAREQYEQLYTPERNYIRLMEIYRDAMQTSCQC